MEVHSHGHETLNMNKEADKVYSPEFKDNLAPPSSQIPDAENFMVTPPVHDARDNSEKTSNALVADSETATNPTFTLPPPASAGNSAPTETNLHSHESVAIVEISGHVTQYVEQEEVFDDMIVLSNGMVTSASMTTGGADCTDIQVGDFQQAPLTDIFLPTSEPSVDIAQMNVGDASGAMEDRSLAAAELPVNVISEVMTVSEAVVQEYSNPVWEVSELEASISLTGATEAAIPAVESSGLPQDIDTQGEVNAEQSPAADAAKANLPEATDTAAHPVQGVADVSGDNDHPSNVVSAEDIQAIKGQKVLKKFGRKNFSGEVTDYDPETKWFKVIYEDGDEEDLELCEVKFILASSTNEASSSKKRSRAERGTNGSAKKSSKNAKQSGAESTTKKRRKSVVKSSAKCPKTPGSQAKGSKSVSKRAQSPEKVTKKAALDSSALKIPGSAQGTVGRKRGSVGYTKGGKGGSSRKKKSTEKVSRNLNLQSPTMQRKGKSSKARPESSQTKGSATSLVKAEDTSKLPASGAKRRTQGIETSGSNTKRLKEAEESTKGDEAIHIGKHVKKDFGGMIYSGVVTNFDKKTQYYKVKYEDGDQEELELRELEPILVQEAGSAQDNEKEAATVKRK